MKASPHRLPDRRQPGFSLAFVDRGRVFGLALILAAFTAVGVAEDFSTAFLDALPKQDVDRATLTSTIVKQLEAVEDLDQRIQLLGSAGTLLRGTPELRRPLLALVEKALEAADGDQVQALGKAASHFPALRGKVLDRIEDPKARERILWHYIMNSEDYTDARMICGQFQPTQRRHALNAILPRAPTLDEKMAILKEVVKLYPSSTYCLLRYATEAPQTICDFLEGFVSPDNSIQIYLACADTAIEKGKPAAAKLFMDAAWSRIPDTTKPYEHVPYLLDRDFREVDRRTWIAKFDQYVLPGLRDGKTHIGSLSKLAKFDIELMIDRTKRSLVDPARGFENRLPKIMDDAFSVNPEGVLKWLETTDSPLKTQAILRITRFMSLIDELKQPSSRGYITRLCDLALEIDDEDQCLFALANIARGLHWLKVDTSKRVIDRGRELMKQHFDFMSIDFYEGKTSRFFWLGTEAERKRLLKSQIEQLRDAKEYQRQIERFAVCRYIADSGLPADDQRALFHELEAAVRQHSNRYLQTRLASICVSLDPAWSIAAIWNVLPEDRGRSGKQLGGIDWTPPPDDAGDAINWLRIEINPADADVELTVALWKFLPNAPAVDRDSIRKAICESLTRHGELASAAGIARQVEDLVQQAELWIGLRARQVLEEAKQASQ